ncbi:MAG: hypothetical protein OSJ60_09455 [Lachnospiraceae bacterium]|nr:hypothetical protein [Lachnospiraceae bacterium]
MVDNIYQSIKAFLKSFLNLLLAVIDLVTSLINGLASILIRLKPHISQKYSELKRENESKRNDSISNNFGREEALVEEIRNECKQKVTSREKYFYIAASVSNEGDGFYAVVIAVLLFAFFGVSMIFGISTLWQARAVGIIAMAVLCIAGCIIISGHRKKMLKNRLLKKILEEEFSEKTWETIQTSEESQSDQTAVIQAISVVGK